MLEYRVVLLTDR